ncbi:MAG: archease [Nitrospirae bacterium]|nr:archease [Nitrospirota bacterium]
MKQFELLDISGDAGIRAFGKDLPELFINAAAGMYGLITDLRDIQAGKTLEISVKGSSLEGLLVSFLNELIFHFDTYGFTGKSISIQNFQAGRPAGRHTGEPESGQADKPAGLQAYKLKAVVTGEEFDPERHKGKLLIKAATYHKLLIEKTDGLYRAEIIFDI